MSSTDTTTLKLVGQRLVAEKVTLRLRTIAIARKILNSLKQIRNQIFPTQRAAPPFELLPGYSAELDIQVSAPGSSSINVYSESTPLIGGTALESSQAQVVALDKFGGGSAVISVAAKDDRSTGQAALRVVAVRPELPDDIAAEITELHIAQEGTGSLVNMSLLFLVAFGFTAEVIVRGFPFLALMISIWLGFMLLNAPKFEGIRFEPRRLLPLKRRLKSAGLALFGFAIWSFSMLLNVNNGGDDDDYGYILLDNITTFVASFGLAFCVFLALSPAIRPKGVAGRLIILTALIPLLFYDLTLIDRDSVWLNNLADNFPYLGWGLGSIPLLLFCILNRVGRWWHWALTVLLLIACVSGLVMPDSVEAPDGLAIPKAVFVGVAILIMAAIAAILLRLVVAPVPAWRFFRKFMFLLLCLATSLGLKYLFVDKNSFMGVSGESPVALYQHCEFGGYNVSLPAGQHDLGKLEELGVKNNDASSIKVSPGWQAIIYVDDEFGGRSQTIVENVSCFVDLGFNDVVSSVRVEKVGVEVVEYLFLGFALLVLTIIWMLLEVGLWNWRRSKGTQSVVKPESDKAAEVNVAVSSAVD